MPVACPQTVAPVIHLLNHAPASNQSHSSGCVLPRLLIQLILQFRLSSVNFFFEKHYVVLYKTLSQLTGTQFFFSLMQCWLASNCYITQACLEFLIQLLPLPKYWNCGFVLPCLTSNTIFIFIFKQEGILFVFTILFGFPPSFPLLFLFPPSFSFSSFVIRCYD